MNKEKIAVQAQEFFSIYFGHFFGKDLPFSNKYITAPNLFSTALYDATQSSTTFLKELR